MIQVIRRSRASISRAWGRRTRRRSTPGRGRDYAADGPRRRRARDLGRHDRLRGSDLEGRARAHARGRSRRSGANLTLDGPLAIDFSGRIRPTKGDASLASLVSGRFEIEDRATRRGPAPSGESRRSLRASSGSSSRRRMSRSGSKVSTSRSEFPRTRVRAGYPIALRARRRGSRDSMSRRSTASSSTAARSSQIERFDARPWRAARPSWPGISRSGRRASPPSISI